MASFFSIICSFIELTDVFVSYKMIGNGGSLSLLEQENDFFQKTIFFTLLFVLMHLKNKIEMF
jgi:hypothetical protein